ncbi:MAG: HEPN domain-containing protein [Hyphomicrobiales bacterium]
MSKEKQTFDLAIARAEHFLILYDITKNRRKRSVRSDWSQNFKSCMNWKQSDTIMRIDGKDSVLILRTPPEGLTSENFEHDFASELLRSALVASVSALDRYMHDIVVNRALQLLNGPKKDVPKKLKNLDLPISVTFDAMKKLRSDRNSRPGNQVKKAIQDRRHRQTFQSTSGIDNCAALLGKSGIWSQVGTRMSISMDPDPPQRELNKIVKRRNQIVHEADLERKISAKKDTLRKIERKDAAGAIGLISDFVNAADGIPTAR